MQSFSFSLPLYFLLLQLLPPNRGAPSICALEGYLSLSGLSWLVTGLRLWHWSSQELWEVLVSPINGYSSLLWLMLISGPPAAPQKPNYRARSFRDMTHGFSGVGLMKRPLVPGCMQWSSFIVQGGIIYAGGLKITQYDFDLKFISLMKGDGKQSDYET